MKKNNNLKLEKKLKQINEKKFLPPFQKLIIALIIIIILIIINQKIQKNKSLPKSTFFDKNQEEISQQISNIIYLGSNFSFSDKMETFSLSTNPHNDLIKLFTQKYKMIKSPDAENLYLNDEYFFNFDQNLGEYYTLSVHQPPNILPIGLDSEQAIIVANQIITSFFPQSQLVPQKNDLVFLSGELMLGQTTKDKASFIQIPYTCQLNQSPLFYQKISQLPFLITLSSDYKLIKLEFSPLFFNFKINQILNTLSLNEVLDNINKNRKAIIIDAFNEENIPIESNKIISGQLLSAKLEYRIDDSNNLAFPVFRFEGNFKNNLNEEFKGTLITPATK